MALSPEAAHPGLAAMERLRRIVEAVRDTDDGEWLNAALDRYELRAPSGARFDETLKLAPGPGQQPWWSARRRAERDRLIRELADTYSGPPWSRAQVVADELRRYETTAWRHDKARGGPLTSDLRRKLLFAIFSADDRPPPTGTGRVYAIVTA
jgi:hypothetical protein